MQSKIFSWCWQNLQKIKLLIGKLKIGNKIADKIIKVSKNLQQNNTEAVTNEHDKETPKERHISPLETQGIIDEPRLIK